MTYSQQALASSWSGNHQLLLLRVTWFSFPCSPHQCMGHLFPESAQARFVPMTAHLQNVRKSHLGICDIENGFCLVSPEAWVTVFDRCLSSQGKRANTGQREGAPGGKAYSLLGTEAREPCTRRHRDAQEADEQMEVIFKNREQKRGGRRCGSCRLDCGPRPTDDTSVCGDSLDRCSGKKGLL